MGDDGVPPRLYHAVHVRSVEVGGRRVILDLTAGTYDVTDEVGAAMWARLLLSPDDRDIESLASQYDVSPDVIAGDLAAFAAAQQAAGRLVADSPVGGPPRAAAPRRRPTALRALRERAGADRDLRRDFSSAYAARTSATADTVAPRLDVDRLVAIFRKAESLYPASDAPLDCLPRSLALTSFLRTSGWPAEHVIGVALYPFEAHAWVELDGVALNEGATYLHRAASGTHARCDGVVGPCRGCRLASLGRGWPSGSRASTPRFSRPGGMRW